MSIDTSQFLQAFYEESFDGLDIMESSLLSLDGGEPDLESINTIFRAAHSIKGGAATFGLGKVASFTHLLETLLDEMRDGRRQVTQSAVDLLLSCVDCLRDMLADLKQGNDRDPGQVDELKSRLAAVIDGSPSACAGSVPQAGPEITPGARGGCGVWRIRICPQPHLFRTGNDPLRMLRELAELGQLSAVPNMEAIPPIESLDPEECHLAWDLVLTGEIGRDAIEEVFAWVADDCELDIVQGDVCLEGASATPGVRSEAGEGALKERRKADRRTGGTGAEAGSIRVGIEKIDSVINLVGELVITQSMLSTFGDNFELGHLQQLREGLEQLDRNTRELQENVMRMRMLPISFVFNRFPRMVRDVSGQLGKQVDLELHGEGTELDKTLLEMIGDPLVHLVRNALDHGIEGPGERRAAGKPEAGVLRLNAYHKGGNIIIEVADDGAGLDRDRILAKARTKGLVEEGREPADNEIHEFIFHPGFSTADAVNDLSGRGVGMDVVQRNIKALGGNIDIATHAGTGTTFTIRLPLTLSILDGQLVRVGDDTYVIPLVSIIESLQVKSENLNSIAGKAELYKLRDDYIPVVRLHELFGLPDSGAHLDGALLVVVEGDGRKAGVLVDDLLGQQQVVVKSLETNFQRIEGMSGATILGDGTVALIMDSAGLIQRFMGSRGNALGPEAVGQLQTAVA